MGKLLDLPASLLAATHTERGELHGAAIEIECESGDILRGELRQLDIDDRRLSLRPEAQKTDLTLRFSDIRLLRFLHDLAPVAKTAEHKVIHPAVGFEIHFDHESEARLGHSRDMEIDGVALHLLVEEEGALHRWLVPLDRVVHYRVGDLSGAGKAGPGECGEIPSLDQPVGNVHDLLRLLASPHYQSHLSIDRRHESRTQAQESSRSLSRRLGVPYIDLHRFDIDPRALACIPEHIARDRLVMPLALLNEHLVVAMERPADHELLHLLHFVSGRSIESCGADRDDLVKTIQHHYGVHSSEDSLQELELIAQQEIETQLPAQEVERMGTEKPIVRLVNNILTDAIRRRASDIHIRPGDKQVELLFRLDGTLVPVRDFSKVLLPAVVARIKILGRMNIAERRLPQDGRARMVDRSTVVDLRISVIPTVKGESVVIRLLNVESGLRGIGEIGFTTGDAELFTDLLRKSYGMILVTGPTGSGKSTTLYAALQEVRKQNVNIITVEDPVEYRMDNVLQIQVNNVPGFTFARALRNILRHDPDVIMVGEIRDQETGKIAVESALTGHLVLSTLHTNDAPTAVTRLVEMGVESFLVKSSVLGVLAQRLVRINCPDCMAVEPVDRAMRKFLGVSEEEVFYHGAGCSTCSDTGYKGRMAVYELLVMTPRLRDMLQEDTPVDAIRAQAISDGMRPLTAQALQVARDKRISLAEVYRVRLQ